MREQPVQELTKNEERNLESRKLGLHKKCTQLWERFGVRVYLYIERDVEHETIKFAFSTNATDPDSEFPPNYNAIVRVSIEI
jgi:hypothetical protein